MSRVAPLSWHRRRETLPKHSRQPAEASFAKTMVSPFRFLQEVRAEADKVTWPSRRETLVTTGLVIVLVIFQPVLPGRRSDFAFGRHIHFEFRALRRTLPIEEIRGRT